MSEDSIRPGDHREPLYTAGYLLPIEAYRWRNQIRGSVSSDGCRSMVSERNGAGVRLADTMMRLTRPLGLAKRYGAGQSSRLLFRR
jgi:hypothetical protein